MAHQDEVSDKAVELGVHLAKVLEEPLELISSWGIPTLLSRSAEFMGGGLAPVGESFQRNLDARVAAIRAAEPALEVMGPFDRGSFPYAGFDASVARTAVFCCWARMLVPR